jgi:hypothetical protein
VSGFKVIGMTDVEYHANPALSSSGARKLTPPSTPAHFHYERTHPRVERAEFDYGHAAHGMVLGVGQPLSVVNADSWRTEAAKDARQAAYASGAVPLLRKDFEKVRAMAAALREHPLASALLSDGTPEVSGFWTDDTTGVDCRVRFDWLPDIDRPGRVVVADYKTTGRSADPHRFARSAVDFGYHQQHPWYLDGLAAIWGVTDASFVFVVQEVEPPYAVSVVELDAEAVALGDGLNRGARRLFAECTETGIWPGYTDDEPALVSLPAYAFRSATY